MPNQAIDIPCKVRKIRFERDLFSICEMETAYRDIPQDACIDFLAASTRGEAVFVALGEGIRTKVGAKVLLSGTWEPNKKFTGQLQLHVSDCPGSYRRGKRGSCFLSEFWTHQGHRRKDSRADLRPVWKQLHSCP